MSTQVIPVVSGGLDSSTMVYHLRKEGYEIPAIVSFHYGQRHARELQFATLLARKLEVEHQIVDLRSITELLALGGSSLVSDTPVPEGHYAEDNMKKTIVPNRNAIMLNVAVGYAVALGADYVATAVHAGDHAIYPDCRPEFIRSMSEAVRLGNEGFHGVLAPFVYSSKADIAYIAMQLGVPLHMTYSCYKGGNEHCGKCGTCVERLEAIAEATERFANVYDYPPVDETVYQDSEFWKTAVGR